VLRRRGDGGADLEQVNRMKTSSRMVGLLVSLLLFDGCAPKPSGTWQGYIEGEFVYVAAPLSGTLTNLAVNRGLEVKTGQLLFELDREPEAAAAREAEQRLAQAKSRLENLMKGRRPTEIAALEAQLAKARASLRLSDLELDRANRMIEEKVIAPAELDLAKARRDADQAQVESLAAELETARLGARADEIQAAAADLQAGRVHAPGDLQPGEPRQARVHGGGCVRSRRRPDLAARPTGRCEADSMTLESEIRNPKSEVRARLQPAHWVGRGVPAEPDSASDIRTGSPGTVRPAVFRQVLR
jgi:multidrug efflux pump subunit AcrA (membrane-fusion protein)